MKSFFKGGWDMSKIVQQKKSIFPTINRLEALTDGVFAIVMTLLVLDISLSTLADASVRVELIQRLFELSPKFYSYAISFVVLGEFWHQHYVAYQHIKRSDTALVWINILGLMFVALVPFSTSVLSEYTISMGNIPFVLYAINVLMILIMRIILLTYAAGRYPIVDSEADSYILRRMKLVTIIASLVFALAIGVSFISIIAALCVFPLAAIFVAVVPRLVEGVK